MKYAIGIDGGGTKTLGILADRDGRVLASASVGGTNHQICGASTAGQRWRVWLLLCWKPPG